MPDEQKVQKILERLEEIPSVPVVVLKLVRLIGDPSSTGQDVARTLQLDPGLSAKILKLVNSAFYGLPGKVGSIERAVVLLGFRTVKQVALGASIMDSFAGDAADEWFDPNAFWQHSLLVGLVAQELGKKTGPADEEIFLLGMIHDVGKVVLRQYLPAEFAEVCRLASRGAGGLAAERELLGTDHAEIGRWLCQRWVFPESFRMVCRYHHVSPALLRLENAELLRKVGLVYLANQWSHHVLEAPRAVDQAAHQSLGLDPAECEEVAKKAALRAGDMMGQRP